MPTTSDPHIRPALRGVFTALVTPMNRDGSLDLGALDALVDAQLAGKIDGLVPCGTTGESVTLDAQEWQTVVGRVAKRVAGRVPVIAGTGSNNTAKVVENQKKALDLGASHALVVTPYYNKPTPEGLYRHYLAVAEAAPLPVILYNVPGRTGCDLKPETVARLASVPNIVGIKEAAGDLDRVTVLRRSVPNSFTVRTGDDPMACAWTLLGGDGVVSVASNTVPAEMVRMLHAALADDAATARASHNLLRDLFSVLFIESNPIPVKAFLALQNRIQEAYRLPLCELRPENREKLRAVMTAGGWL